MSLPHRIYVIHDVLATIFEILEDDRVSLYCCSLVCHEFASAASRVLYRRVTWSPVPQSTLDLRRKNEFADGILYAACLPHNADKVLHLEISGYLPPRPASLGTFATHLPTAIRLWRNLNTIVLAPKQYHKDVFIGVFPLLRSCAFLRSLTINASCITDDYAPVVATVEDLECLSILNPTRAILQLLPDWLGILSRTLRRLSLRDNCGSVTPGVLRSCVPHLTQIQALALGLSYSLGNDDVFAFVQGLPNLKDLDLRYYLQFRTPSIAPRLHHLRTLVVRHNTVDTVEDVAYLCKWIRRIVTHARLAEIRLICEEENSGASVKFDGLLAHLSQIHAQTLRVVRLDAAFVGMAALRALCATCVELEELAVAISGNAVAELPEILSSLGELRTLRVEARNVERGHRLMSKEKVAEFMVRGPPQLRRLSVYGKFWQGRWVCDDKHETAFVAEEAEKWQVRSWEQGYNP